MSERTLHINAVMQGFGQYAGAWRAATTDPAGVTTLAHYRRIAEIAERGTFDTLFLPDVPQLTEDIEHVVAQAPDPTVLLAAVAATTTHIGLVATASTTFSEPFDVARRFATLDHLSGGRAGWNIVTTARPKVARNFGNRGLPVHADRYRRGAEFVDVTRRLWDSWGDGGVVADRETGRFADLSRIAPIDHDGEFFQVTGPLPVPRPPQGHPVLFQAGASEHGLDFAARYADAVFTVQHTIDQALAYTTDLKARARGHGRTVKVFPGFLPIVGETREAALERQRSLEALIPLEYGRRLLAERLQIDVALLELDQPVDPSVLPDAETIENGSRGFFRTFSALVRDEQLTVADMIRRLGGGRGHQAFPGTATEIADRMQEWFEAGAADGFVLFADVLPDGLERFVDLVVPELRRRALFRERYTGTTLREHYGLARPVGERALAGSTV